MTAEYDVMGATIRLIRENKASEEDKDKILYLFDKLLMGMHMAVHALPNDHVIIAKFSSYDYEIIQEMREILRRYKSL